MIEENLARYNRTIRSGAAGTECFFPGECVMRLTVTSHLTLDGVMQSNGKPEPELKDGFDQGGSSIPLSWAAASACSPTGPPRLLSS